MKTIDLKLPKRKESTKAAEPMIAENEDRWPYGMQLRFEAEQVDKLPSLKGLKVGQKVSVEGIGEVTSIRMNEEKDGKEKYSVEVQLHEVGCEAKGKTKPESMGDAMGRAMESKRT